MAYFPLFMDLTDKKCLVIGAGRVAYRKYHTLQQFCANICVVAPCAGEDFVREGIPVILRGFAESDLEGMDLVVAASDDPQVNARAAFLAREKGLLVNAATDPENGNFAFPGVVKRGDVVVGVSSSGTDPSLTKSIREKLEKEL